MLVFQCIGTCQFECLRARLLLCGWCCCWCLALPIQQHRGPSSFLFVPFRHGTGHQANDTGKAVDTIWLQCPTGACYQVWPSIECWLLDVVRTIQVVSQWMQSLWLLNGQQASSATKSMKSRRRHVVASQSVSQWASSGSMAAHYRVHILDSL